MKNKTLPEFQNFLVSRKLILENNASFYAYWASKLMAFSNRNENLSHDLNLFNSVDYEKFTSEVIEIKRMLTTFSKKLKADS